VKSLNTCSTFYRAVGIDWHFISSPKYIWPTQEGWLTISLVNAISQSFFCGLTLSLVSNLAPPAPSPHLLELPRSAICRSSIHVSARRHRLRPIVSIIHVLLKRLGRRRQMRWLYRSFRLVVGQLPKICQNLTKLLLISHSFVQFCNQITPNSIEILMKFIRGRSHFHQISSN